MWPLFVVFNPPLFYFILRVFEIQKPMFVETFITQLAIKTLDKSIVHWFTRSCVFDMNPSLLSPLLKVFPRKFWSMIHTHRSRITVNDCALVQKGGYPVSGNR